MKPWLFCLSLIGTLAFVPCASAKTLKIAAIVPDGTTWMTAMRAGADEIETRTEGRVELKFYPGGVMGDGASVLRKMRIGQLQGGAFTVGSLTELYGDAEIYSLPFLFESYAEVDYVRAKLDPVLRRGFEKAGLIALTISEGGFAHLLSKQPVLELRDLQQHKVWSQENDTMSQIAWEIAGVSPVTLALADVFTALQTGLVDTVAGPPVGAIAFQWHTKVGYLTDVPLSYITGVLAIDARAWKKISAADQAIVREVLDRVNRELDRETRQSDKDAREALRNQGLEFVRPSDAELVRWRSIADATAKRLQADGTYSPEILGRLRQLLDEYRSREAAEELPAKPAPGTPAP